uniref:Calcium voltage-gated channel auxiliary subunit alpha2delta 1 n=1 Tax=Pseudonaja textilis TaxID=8673 RepID=A0A670YM83_PSETE
MRKDDTTVAGSNNYKARLLLLHSMNTVNHQLTTICVLFCFLLQIYQRNKNLYTVEANNARQLVESAAQDIEKLLSNRSTALVRLAEAAEKFQKEHQWQDEFAVSSCFYFTDFPISENETGSQRIKPVFEEDPLFGRQTSYQHAAVHIPTDIYDGSTIVLNELNWTGALDEVFKKNREEDQSLLWQVFGSATGLARYYPGNLPSCQSIFPIMYIQGAASPKDMLILVDASGSVSGLTLKLIRTSVIEMLETLSDDDFVNVVSFNDKAQNVSCFNHLVQANVRNKKKLKEAVYKIQAKGITDYKKGFSYAFEQLLNSVFRANCNKIIMLFTDGGEEKAQEIFEKYNKDKKVRVFTFSVGQHNYDKGPIQWMACENKGYYYEIPSIGAIRINTQEYLDVLGRPMVMAEQKAKQVQWTNVYLDALELGLVISGTLPVFNFTKDQNNVQNQLILGVMGVDVSLEEIKKVTPRFTLCPNGYYFAIDPNGYVLLHPNLQPKNPKSQEPVTLDFLDAELENDIKVEIRKKMIDGESGDRTFQTLVKSQDERYIDKGNRTYTWTAVNGTDYSLALVLPSYSFYYIKAKINETLTQAKFIATLKRESFDEVGYTFLAPRDYCSTVKITDNNTVFLQNFIEFMDQYSPENPSCNGLVMRALLDAGFTSDLVQNYWSKQDPEGITARFVATDGGITRVYPKSAGEYWTENAETYEQSFYKRSLDNENYIFTAPFFNRKSLEIDPGLMRNLINMSLYAFNKSYDYQSVCDPEDEPKQGAGLRSINVPTIADILHLGWWASAAAWSILQQLVWGLTFPRFLGAVEVEEEDFSGFPSKQSCITVQTQYFFGSDDKSFNGILDCINCSRLFHAEKISNTNLVFIMSDSKELCHHCDARPLMQAEKPDEGPNPCEMVQHPRYRKGPDACFDDAKDDSTECGGVSGLSPSLWSMVGIQFILLWMLSGSRPCQL